MSLKTQIKKLLIDNWKPKLICLVCAVVVWLTVHHLQVRSGNPEWSIDDIRVSIPE